MSGVSSIGEPFLIPRDILSKDEQIVFDMVPEAERKIRYKWWSMHDIMKYYHSGFIPLENDANIFAFRIDLTAPELIQNKYRDNGLGSSLESAMMNLNNVTNAIAQVFTDTKNKLITQQQETTMNATMRRGGKKGSRKIKGGDSFQVIPNLNDPAFSITEAFSSQKLKNECLNDLEKDIFNSRNRIFVVDGKLPLYNAPTVDVLKTQETQLEEELKNANNMPAVQVGGRRTRKQRKHKKSKTRRTRR
jgi:hypothetical protein